MPQKMDKAAFQERIRAAKENLNKFATLPIGPYLCLLLKAIKIAKKDKTQVCFVYKVQEGDHRGREHRAYYSITSEGGFNMFIQDLSNLGYPIDQITSEKMLYSIVEQLEKDRIYVNIRISENPDPNYANFPRTRIEEVVDVSDDAVEAQTVSTKPIETTDEDVTIEETSDSEDNSIDIPANPTPVEDNVVVEEDTPIEDEEEDDDVDVGDQVRFTFRNEEKIGQIVEIDNETSTAIILSGGKKYKVKPEKMIAKV